jgi:hypothetical protein
VLETSDHGHGHWIVWDNVALVVPGAACAKLIINRVIAIIG